MKFTWAVAAVFFSTSLALAEPTRVLVLPFNELAEQPTQGWIGDAVRQSLTAELSRMGIVQMATLPEGANAVQEIPDALELGRNANAEIVVFGSYQIVNDELRITGQTVDVEAEKTIGGLKATGLLRDLFGIEDIIGAQVKRDLITYLQPAAQTTAPTDPFAGETPPATPQPPKQQPQPPADSGTTFTGSDLQRSLVTGTSLYPPPPINLNYNYNVSHYGSGHGYGYGHWCGFYPPIIIKQPVVVKPQPSNRKWQLGALHPDGIVMKYRQGHTMHSDRTNKN